MKILLIGGAGLVLLRDGQFAFAALNLVISNAVGLLMVWAGYSIAKVL